MKRLAAALLTSLVFAPAAQAAPAPNPTPTFPNVREDVAVMLWLRQNTSLRLGESVVFGRDNVLVVVSDEPDPRNAALHRVSFRQEATSIEFVSRTGGRSVRGVADVDCTNRQVRAQSVALFTGSDLRGEQITAQGPDQAWRAPLPGTASAIVVAEVCAPPRAARPVPAPAPQPPQPPPAVVAVAPPAAPAARPAPPARAAPPPPAAPPATRAAPAPAPARAVPPPQPAPAREAAVVAQIGAFTTRALAESAWSQATAAFPGGFTGRTVRIEPTVVNGATVFRTYVQGFPDEPAARALCGELMARSQPCFVRRLP